MADKNSATPTPQPAAGGDVTKVYIDGSPVQMPTADILLADGTPNVPVLRAVLLTYSATTANAEITQRKDASGKIEVLVTRRAGAKGLGVRTGHAQSEETLVTVGGEPATVRTRHGEQDETAAVDVATQLRGPVEIVGVGPLPATRVAPSATYAAILEHLGRVRRRRNPARVMAELLAALEVRRGLSFDDLRALQPDIRRALERGLDTERRTSDIPTRLAGLTPRRAQSGVIDGL